MFGSIVVPISRARFGALVFLALAVLPLAATSVLAPRFEALVDRADLIFTGRATSQRCEWRIDNGQRSIVTLVSFAVQQVHKGRAGSSITLQFLGGSVGDVTLEVSDMPKFRPGEHVVLFVEGNGVNVSPVVGFYHGKFSLKKDESGRDTVLRHDGEPLTASASSGGAKSAPAGRVISHEEFVDQIQQRLAVGRK